jgi:hypothetical protein
VGSRGIFLEDAGNPTGGPTTAEYEAMSRSFDDLVYPTITANFGVPTDIDGNGRVMILFTRAVNELTPRDSESLVGGFFYSRDLFPTRDEGAFRACAASNAGELLYMLAADPTGTINGHVRSRDYIVERSVGVIAHELQHLINSSRRLRIMNVANWNEEFWLNEGLSHIAEELLFFATTQFGAGQGITLTQLRNSQTVLNRFNEFQVSNVGRYSSHLRNPTSSSPISGTDLGTRGAAWSFLRYAADRRGGNEGEFWRRLVDSPSVGYTNLTAAIGSSPFSWLHDWYVSKYVDGLVQVPTQFRQPTWNHRSIMPALSSNNGSYPLSAVELKSGSATRMDLPAGGGGFMRARASAGTPLTLRFASGAAEPPPELRYTIVRIR